MIRSEIQKYFRRNLKKRIDKKEQTPYWKDMVENQDTFTGIIVYPNPDLKPLPIQTRFSVSCVPS